MIQETARLKGLTNMQIMWILDSIPVNCAIAVRMHMAGKINKEIGEILNVSPSRAREILFKGLRILRSQDFNKWIDRFHGNVQKPPKVSLRSKNKEKLVIYDVSDDVLIELERFKKILNSQSEKLLSYSERATALIDKVNEKRELAHTFKRRDSTDELYN